MKTFHTIYFSVAQLMLCGALLIEAHILAASLYTTLAFIGVDAICGAIRESK